jgi:hypothetical protein
VIDSTVLDHAHRLTSGDVATFEIWTFCVTDTAYSKARARYIQADSIAGCPIRIFRACRPALPGSLWANRLLFWMHLRRHRPRFDILHARTDYSAAVAAIGKHARSLLIWDCRGDTVAEQVSRLVAAQWPPVLISFVGWRSERTRHTAGRVCDRAIFVSEALARLCARYVSGKPFEVIPTAASENMFYFDPSLRCATRKELGFSPESLVFVYSGSLAPYQCFEETVALFREVHAVDPRTKLLVVTPATEAARKIASDSSCMMILSSKFSRVNSLLNAADVGLVMRKPSPINSVAMPTKFAEYCLAGLPVITSDAVPEAYAKALEIGNLAFVQQGILTLPPAFDRTEIARKSTLLLGRSSRSEQFRRIYLS